MMPLDARSIAINMAVLCFFGTSVLGWFSKFTPFICCKRALIAATFAYIITTCAAKAINAIITNAMIESQLNEQKEKTVDDEN